MANSIISKQHLNEYIAVIAVSLQLLVLGTLTGTVSPMIVILEEDGYHEIPPISKTVSSWIVYSLNIGIFFGGIINHYLSDFIGKKYALIWSIIPQLLSHIFIYYAINHFMICASIAMRGLFLAMCYGLIPCYVSEVTSAQLRGPSTAFGMMLVPIGGLIGGMIESVASISHTTILLAVFGMCTMPFLLIMPESPYYFVSKKRNDECIRALRKLRRTENVDKEFLEIQTTWSQIEKLQNVSWIELFRNKLNRRVFFICAGIQFVQHFSGFVPLFAFSNNIIFNSGLNLSLLTTSILTNGIGILFHAISMFVIETIGRRLLFLIVCIMVIVSHASLGSGFYFEHYYTSIWFGVLKTSGMLGYLSAFGFGFSFIHNLMAAELFPSDFKSKGASILVMMQAIEAIIVTTIYSQLSLIVDYLPILVFLIITVIGLILGNFFIPETKNKTLAEIQKELNFKS